MRVITRGLLLPHKLIALGGATMANVTLNKEERLQYIKETAIRMREEKKRDFEITQTETEYASAFNVESDVTMLDEFCGMVSTGVAKIKGGFRHMPVIIL
jgi:hypothetical protein